MMQKYDTRDRTVRQGAGEEQQAPRLRLRIEELETRITPDPIVADPPILPPPLP